MYILYNIFLHVCVCVCVRARTIHGMCIHGTIIYLGKYSLHIMNVRLVPVNAL